MASLIPLAGFRKVASMSIALGSRLFLLAGLLLPAFAAAANLNLGDSPLREISLGKPVGSRAMAPSVGPFSDWSAANPSALGHFESDRMEAKPDESCAKEEDPGDERYFGSATWSEVSKPRMVDFSFGQPSGPVSWWKSSEAESSTVALASPAVALPKTTFEWGDLREPVNPSRRNVSTSAGMTLLPLSLIGVLGLMFRRGN